MRFATAALCAGLLLPLSARAATTADNFLVNTTGDLVALCSSSTGDPNVTAAQNFCHGFMVGAYRVLSDWQTARRAHFFCVPTPAPTRSEAVAAFLAWAQANPARMSERPEDGVLRFLEETYSCKGKTK
jgi:hypothetical protein